MEKLIAAIFDEEGDDLLVYCVSDSATDVSVKGKMILLQFGGMMSKGHWA
jgi:hypothetical protein